MIVLLQNAVIYGVIGYQGLLNMTSFRETDEQGSRQIRTRENRIKQYENRCPLLSYEALKRLKERGGQREQWLDELLEAPSDETDCQRAARRQRVIEAAELAVIEGVQQFADGIVLTQGRLTVHAVLLREYTALLFGEIRDRINASELFQQEPLPMRQADSIAQEAIHACEDILAERSKIDDPLCNGIDGYTPNPALTWSPLVQAWEALKFASKVVTECRERIPESDLRKLIVGQYGGSADDLTFDDFKQHALELCRHYRSFQIAPDEIPAEVKPKEAVSRASGQFWKEREEEFRRYDTPANMLLGAMASGSDWHFVGGPGGYPIDEPRQFFQSLAREAAKGLAGPLSAEPWVDWLNALQHARDKSTGELRYAKITSHGTTIGEDWLSRMEQLGELVPTGGETEFVLITENTTTGGSESEKKLKVGTRLCWDTPFVTIELLFRASANYCLELRSLSTGARDIPSQRSAQGTEVDSPPKRELNADLINKWIRNEGYENKDLAEVLGISARAVSSIRNNGNSHGWRAVAKLANEMNRDVEDLYLP